MRDCEESKQENGTLEVLGVVIGVEMEWNGMRGVRGEEKAVGEGLV